MPPSEPSPPRPDWPRYAPGRTLPRYRYVPGLHPHPVSDPAGHSYGHRPDRIEVPEPEDWKNCGPYLWAVDLHNFAYWWEAHEAWEGLWQETDKKGPQALFLQGLIQVSAAMLKAHLGSAAGRTVLLNEALAKLRPVAASHARYMGLDVRDYVKQASACLTLPLPLPAKAIPMIRLL